MKKCLFLLSLAFVILPSCSFAQGNLATRQSVSIQNQNLNQMARMQNTQFLYNGVMHSKFIVSKQRQIDVFKKLISRNDAKIYELENEINVLENESGNFVDKEKNTKKLKRKRYWLEGVRKEKQKFQDEIFILESQMGSENK